MIKHKQFNEVQSYIGRVPRADEFIAIAQVHGYRRSAGSGFFVIESTIEKGDPVWTKGYHALVYQGKVMCVWIKHGNDNKESEHFAIKSAKRVLNLK